MAWWTKKVPELPTHEIKQGFVGLELDGDGDIVATARLLPPGKHKKKDKPFSVPVKVLKEDLTDVRFPKDTPAVGGGVAGRVNMVVLGDVAAQVDIDDENAVAKYYEYSRLGRKPMDAIVIEAFRLISDRVRNMTFSELINSANMHAVEEQIRSLLTRKAKKMGLTIEALRLEVHYRPQP